MNEEAAIKVVDKVLKYIEDNIMKSITLQELSALTGYSPWYVARIFKEVTKKSPYEYIRFRRLNKAALMLRDKERKVIDIALDMVYESQEGFTRAFTKEFGISPGRYRAMNRQNPMNLPVNDFETELWNHSRTRKKDVMESIYFNPEDWKLDDLVRPNNALRLEVTNFEGEAESCWSLKGKNWNWTTIRQEIDGLSAGDTIDFYFWAKIDFYGKTGDPKCNLEIIEYGHWEDHLSFDINSRSPYAIAKAGEWVLYHFYFTLIHGSTLWLRFVSSQVNIAIAKYSPGDELKSCVEPVSPITLRPVTECTYESQDPEVFTMPAAKIIGKSIRIQLVEGEDSSIPDFYQEFHKKGWDKKLSSSSLPSLISGSRIGFMDDYNAEDNTYMYMIGVLCPADTLVADEFESRDIPETLVFQGKPGEWIEEGKEYFINHGYVWNDAQFQNWNAELYFDGEELQEDRLMPRLLCPVRVIETNMSTDESQWAIIASYQQDLPASRFIGRRYGDADKKDGMFQWLWGEWFKTNSFAPLEELLTEEFKRNYEEANSYVGMIRGKHGEEGQYWIGMFLPTDAIVPDGYEFIDIPSSKLGVCWIQGLEEEVYCKEEQCSERLVLNEMNPIIASDGAWWRFERYNCPRFTQKDENGKIILDMCHFLNTI